MKRPPEQRNRIFRTNPEEKIKEVLSEAAKRKRANKVINNLLKQFKGKSLIQILPALSRHSSPEVVRVAIERIRNNKTRKPTPGDLAFLREIEESLNSC